MLILLGLAELTANLFGAIDMLNISGLTQEQVDMLDIIWSFDTKDEYDSWFELLDDEEASMCFGLMELLTLAIIDEALESKKVDPYKEANQVINQIKKLTQNK
jgi:hypothetical protein